MKKNVTFGLEVEFILLDEAGHVSNSADILLKKCSTKKIGYYLRPEASKCMVEVGATPKPSVRHTAKGFLKNLKKIHNEARKLGLWLYPLATYPGKAHSVIRHKPWYEMQTSVLGKEWDSFIGKMCGFHFHSALPKGVMDLSKGILKPHHRSKAAKLMVEQYNFLIAADPAAITIMQSSPFFEGKLHGKDSRIALYRDMNFPQLGITGIYNKHKILGRLPKYAHNAYDMKVSSEQTKTEFLDALSDKDPKAAKSMKNAHAMRFYWGPVRINKVGTYEERGLDMNLPKYMLGVSTLLKRSLLGIINEGLRIRPSEIGIRQPFKIEGTKVYVPPYNYLVEELTRKSVTYGLSSPVVHNYTKRFYQFATRFIDYKFDMSLMSIKRMIDQKETMSDRVMKRAGVKSGLAGFEIDDDMAAEIALRAARKLERQLDELIDHYIVLDKTIQ
ncbi:hypothetical protein KJ780_02560 [Candidatus Micrarchaeota archaeon]|nr:hypothetical protein [Candidatus Micrarchaeota archaeon]